MPADIRYYEGSGTDEEYVDYILVVAAHRVGSIDEIWFEDQQAWTLAGGVQGEFSGYLTTVTPVLEGTDANTVAINGGTRWGLSCRLTGCAYLHLRIKRTGNTDEEQSPLANGLPGRVTIIGEGMPEYDPRYDSTAGGSGTQRIDDQDSWGASTGIPIIQSLNVLIGWRINGKLSVGAGLPAKYLDLDSAITAANICDEDIALAAGGTQKRYRTAGAFSTDDTPMAIVGALLAGCAGDLLDSEGKLSFLIKTNTLATPEVTFDDHDVVSGASWDAMGGQTNLPNIIAGNFTDPSANSLYQPVPYPSVSIDSEDGIERTMPLDFTMVEDAARAERLAKQTLQRKQYPGIFTAEYNMKGMAAKVGRIVWQTYSPRGWVDKPFRVMKQTPSRSGRIALVLREENAAIYAWSEEDSAAVQTAEPVGFDPRNAGPILLARKAQGAVVPDADGTGGNLRNTDGDTIFPGTIRNDLLELSPAGLFGLRSVTGGAFTELGRARIVDMGGAERSALDQVRRASEKLAEAALRVATEANTSREIVRDAGIYTDPDTGQVRISVVDQTNERVSEAEIRLDAAESSILLRATTSYVDQAIANAVLDPSQIADLDTIFVRLTAAELAIDGNAASITAKADATTVTAVEARVTTAESDIDALAGAITTRVESSTFDALETRVASAENTLTALGDVAAVTSIVRVARNTDRKTDAAALTGLQALLDADRARREQVAAVAEVRKETTARIVSDVSAEASARQALAVRVAGAEAQIVTDRLARIDGDNVVTAALTSLAATVGTNTAAIATEQQARTDGDEALAGQITTLSATVEDNSAAITAEGWARANGDNALAGLITTLAATVDDNAAAISTEEVARTDGDNALAGQITTLSATVDDNSAAITAEGVARAYADNALAGQITTLAATVGDNTGAIETEQQARADGDEALAGQITTLSATIDDNAAAITAEQAARVDGDEAIASSVSTLTTRVNDAEATVTTFAESIDGLEARAGLRLDVNGRVTGFEAFNDGDEGDFLIYADRFAIISPDGSDVITPFEIDDGNVRIGGDLIVEGSVTSSTIADGAAGQVGIWKQNASQAINNTHGVGNITISPEALGSQLASVFVDSVQGKPVKVAFSANCKMTPESGSTHVNFAIVRTLPSPKVALWVGAKVVNDIGELVTVISIDDTLPAGQRGVYQLYGKKANNGQQVSVTYRHGFAEELLNIRVN